MIISDEEKEKQYLLALEIMNNQENPKRFSECLKLFVQLGNYKNSIELTIKCLDEIKGSKSKHHKPSFLTIIGLCLIVICIIYIIISSTTKEKNLPQPNQMNGPEIGITLPKEEQHTAISNDFSQEALPEGNGNITVPKEEKVSQPIEPTSTEKQSETIEPTSTGEQSKTIESKEKETISNTQSNINIDENSLVTVFDDDYAKVTITINPEKMDEEVIKAAKVLRRLYVKYISGKWSQKNAYVHGYFMEPELHANLKIGLSLIDRYNHDNDENAFINGNAGVENILFSKFTKLKDSIIFRLETKWNADENYKDENLAIVCKKFGDTYKIMDVKDGYAFSPLYNGNYGLVYVSNKNGAELYSDDKTKKIAMKVSYGEVFSKNDYSNKLKGYECVEAINPDSEDSFYEAYYINSKDIKSVDFSQRIGVGTEIYFIKTLIGEPQSETSTELYYSPNDIFQIKDGKVVSWTGFEEYKPWFKKAKN